MTNQPKKVCVGCGEELKNYQEFLGITRPEIDPRNPVRPLTLDLDFQSCCPNQACPRYGLVSLVFKEKEDGK